MKRSTGPRGLRVGIGIWVVLAVALVGLEAIAQTPADDSTQTHTELAPAVSTAAEALYNKGVELFERREFAAAAAAFVAAFEADPDPFLAYNAGRGYENDGQIDKARAWFSKALGDGSAEEVVELAKSGLIRLDRMEAAMRDKLVAKTGKLSISSNTSANVFIDGQLKGRTPVDFELDPGVYHVEIQSEGFRSMSREVQLEAGETETVVATLTEPRGLFSWIGWTGLGLMAGGSASVVSGVVFARDAESDFEEAQNLTATEIRRGVRFDDLRTRGEDKKSQALAFYYAGAGLTGAGAALLIYDLSVGNEGAGDEALTLRWTVGPDRVTVAGVW